MKHTLSFETIIDFIILRNFNNLKEKVAMDYLNNRKLNNLNVLPNASCRLWETNVGQKLTLFKKLMKKVRKLSEANQY